MSKQSKEKVVVTPEEFSKMTADDIAKLVLSNEGYGILDNEKGRYIITTKP